MPPLIDRVGDLLPLFAGGTTGLLLVGCALMLLTRAPAYRQRIGELTLIAVLGWLLLACLPLPRLVSDGFWTEIVAVIGAATNGATADADQPSSPVWTSAELAGTEMGWLNGAALGEARGDTIPFTSSDLAESLELLGTDVLATTEHRDEVNATAPQLTPRLWTAGAYGVGSAIFMAWLLGGRIWLAILRRSARHPPAWLAKLFQSLPNDRAAQLLVSRHCPGPISWGAWRPVIVLPLPLVRRRRREQVRMVLLHELAHVARQDSRSNLLFCFALPLLYGHPLFWWLRGQVRLAAELLADDRAAQQAGKLAYAEQLLALAKASPGRVMPLGGAVAFYSSSSQFYRRMQMLVSRTSTPLVRPSASWRLSSLIVMTVIVLTVAGLAGVRPAEAQQQGAGTEDVAGPEKPVELPADETPIREKRVDSAKPVEANQPLTELPLVGRLFAGEGQEPGPEQLKTEAEALRAKLAATEQQVRALEEQLNAIKAQFKVAGAGLRKAPQQKPQAPQQTITLTRVNEDGSISTKNWTTDEDGRPEKLIWKKKSQPGESPIAEAKTTVVQDGRVVKEYNMKDGAVVTHVYDHETGKLMERRQHAAGALPKLPQDGNKPAEATPAKPLGYAVVERAPDQPTLKAADRSSASGLDLVSLATAYADAGGEVEAAKSRLAAVEKAAIQNGPDRAPEFEAARIALRSAQRKYDLLHNLATVAMESAKADVDRAQQLFRAGAAPVNLSHEAQSRLKMLHTILKSSESQGEPLGVPKQP